jgi:hypothetical protein
LIHINPSAVLESVSERGNQMADDKLTPDARIANLESDFAEISRLLAQTIQAVKRNNRMKIWQIIIFAIVMAGTAIGTLLLFPISSR